MVEDDFVEIPDAPLTIVSDASVRLLQGQASGAWQMYHHPSHKRRVAMLQERQIHSHSYRHEHETFYHALNDSMSHLQTPHEITQYMDCKSALDSLKEPIAQPSQTMRTDSDLILSRTALRATCPHSIREEWVIWATLM